MKKAIINTWRVYLLLMLATILYGCERCGDSSTNKPTVVPSPPQTPTEIDYVINLDESKIVKQEGNKTYYDVPLNTQVIIVAATTAPPTVVINWEQTPLIPGAQLNTISIQKFKQQFHSEKHTINSKVISEYSSTQTESSWMFASVHPISITVCGRPHYTGQAEEIKDKIINHDKVFVITWK